MDSDRGQLAAEVRGLLRLLRDQWLLVLVCVVAAGAAAALYLTSKPTTYSAQSRLLLVQDDPTNLVAPVNGQFVDPVRQRATDLELIGSAGVSARVRRLLKLKPTQGLPGSIAASSSGDSNVVNITSTSSDAVDAVRLANGYAQAYIKFRRDSARARYATALATVESRIKSLAGTPGAGKDLARLRSQGRQIALARSLKLADAEVVQTADGAVANRPSRARTMILALAFGLIIGLALAVLRDRLDDRIKSDDDLEAALPGVPFLAGVPAKRHSRRARAAMANSFHNVRVAVSSVDGAAPTVLVTSAMADDGKSTTALNLASALGDESRPALLIDADLRRSGLTEMFGESKGNGVVNVLGARGELESAIRKERVSPPQNGWRGRTGKGPLEAVGGFIALVPTGRTSAAPQRIFTNDGVEELFAQASEQQRPVIVDGPPLGMFSDMVPLARRADAVIVVARLYHTRARALRQLARQLQTAGVTPLGVVVIGTRDDDEPYY